MPLTVGVSLRGRGQLNRVICGYIFHSCSSGVSKVNKDFLREDCHSIVEKPLFEKCEVFL